MMVNSSGEQQGRNGSVFCVAVTVRQHDDFCAVGYCFGDLRLDVFDRCSHSSAALSYRIQAVDRERFKFGMVAVFVEVQHLGEVFVGNHRVGENDLATRVRSGLQNISLRSHN